MTQEPGPFDALLEGRAPVITDDWSAASRKPLRR